MPSKNTKSDEIVETIDKLIEEDDLSTRSGLRLAFSALRDAVSFMSEVSVKISDVEKKVNVMWIGYQIGVWVATVVGGSVIILIWSLITGAATIQFGGVP